MEKKSQRSCILDTCCFCFSVDMGAKIIEYLVIALSVFAIVFNIFVIVVLTAGLTPQPHSNTTTKTHLHVNSTGGKLYVDVNEQPMKLTDHANSNSISSDFKVNDLIRYAITIHSLKLVLHIFILCVHVVILVGLHKRSASCIKFGLIVGVIKLNVAFVLILGLIIMAPSVKYLAMLLFLAVPVYALLVLRSAYYNILENKNIQLKQNFVLAADNIPYGKF